MFARTPALTLVGALVAFSTLTPSCASAQRWPTGPAWRLDQRGAAAPGASVVYQRGYQEGYREGERDGRQRRSFDIRRHDAYRDGDRGYNRAYGDRGRYRDEFRDGFEAGYGAGYQRVRGAVREGRNGRGPIDERRGSFQEPAYARGYADGFDQGRDDWDDRNRYDPVRHREYRSGDNGYSGNYGSRDLYRRYYREGFREGYEDGYRGTNQGRRR
jgi:hypothetical protein